VPWQNVRISFTEELIHSLAQKSSVSEQQVTSVYILKEQTKAYEKLTLQEKFQNTSKPDLKPSTSVNSISAVLPSSPDNPDVISFDDSL